MSDPRPVNELVELGREAAARGSWREAYDLLGPSIRQSCHRSDLELIGEATSWSGPSETVHRRPRTRVRRLPARVAIGEVPHVSPLRLVRDYFLLSGRFRRRGLVEATPSACSRRTRMPRARVPASSACCRRATAGAAERPRGEISEAGLLLRRALEIAQKFGDRDLEVLDLHSQGSDAHRRR